MHRVFLLPVSSPWIFHPQVPMCSLERTSHTAGSLGRGLPFFSGKRHHEDPSRLDSSAGRKAWKFVACPCRANIHSPGISSEALEIPQAQSAERHSTIRASRHGNPWLPSPTHCPPSSTLLADSQDCLLSSWDLQIGPAAPQLQVWLLSDCSLTPRPTLLSSSFPGKALELSLGQTFLEALHHVAPLLHRWAPYLS